MENIYYVFANNIFSKDFKTAVDNLKKYIMVNKDNKNVLLYALLLEELLKHHLDFKFINKLDSYTFDKVEGYQMYYKLTFDSILKQEYEQALKFLREYKIYEKKELKNNSLDTILLEILLEEVMNRDKQDNYPLFKEYFQKLKNDLNEENYEEALKDCHYLKDYTTPNKFKFYNNIEKLINKIIDMQTNHTILPMKSVIYPNTEDYNFILDIALKNSDYETAYKNIGKVIYFEPNSGILKIYQQLLYKIHTLNKNNLKENRDYLSNKIILDLIKAQDFAKLKKVLNENINNDRSFYSFLLTIIKDIETKNYSDKKIAIDGLNIVNYFYHNLSNKNYVEAYNCIDKCLKYTNNTDEKLIIYKELLKFIVPIINKEKSKPIDKELNILYNEIINSNSKIDIEIKLDSLRKVLVNKEELTIMDRNLLNLIDTYFELNNKNIDFDNYFAEISKEDNIIYYFNKAIHFGDYHSVYKIMNSDEWFKNTSKLDNPLYYSVIRKILIVLNIKVQNNKSKEIAVSEFKDNEYLDSLANLKRLIKKREYEEALNYLNVMTLDEESKLYYEILLKHLISTESLKR